MLGLSLCFAAFSNTLTIKSRATVSPDSADFKIKTYGILGDTDETSDMYDINSYTSDKESVPFASGTSTLLDYSNAKISEDGLHLSEMHATFQKSGDNVSYMFAVKNEGKYDAYLDLKRYYNLLNEIEKPNIVCTAREGTTQSLVDATCENVVYYVNFLDADMLTISPESIEDAYFKIAPGGYIFLDVGIWYEFGNGVVADGTFDIDIEDITFDFSTVKPE